MFPYLVHEQTLAKTRKSSSNEQVFSAPLLSFYLLYIYGVFFHQALPQKSQQVVRSYLLSSYDGLLMDLVIKHLNGFYIRI